YGLLFGHTDQHGLSRAVEARADAHARRRIADPAVQVNDHRWPGVELHDADPPRQALAKEQVVAVPKHRGRQQAARAAVPAPSKRIRQAAGAAFTRRILDSAAVFAGLQFEAAL